jgi:protein-S-isoprenylcysteine O-methyltransferase Ste14
MLNLETKIPPLIVMLTVAALMWLLARVLPPMALPQLPTFVAVAALLVVGLLLLILSGALFAKRGTTVNPMAPQAASTLVTTGIYRVTRNPMYVGCYFMLIAWGIFLSNLFSLAFSACFILYMNRFQIGPEERALESTFGAAYMAYKARVRRWL